MITQTTIQLEKTSYQQAKEILNQMGFSYSQIITLFNNMIVSNNGLPFEFKVPNNITKQALYELEIKQGKKFKNIDDLFDDLDS